ncbi:SDR family NAD(P)-dependent oxidoreductase [Tropicimonas marinistellae]|uniref:SDR family NAD(P)-dependent oxidoreductase n=1 Tax=Tropicimonas marinistellae TaxID=1739787 RepID=UPI0008352D83|nr:SDR family NAD(P)-dependent oxidoreductase [Tropicimonas marinistellae]
MNAKKTVLILGASGGVGGAIATALQQDGWHVRAMARHPETARNHAPAVADWRRGDAMNRADVVAAASGVQAIVHAVNPKGYRNWDTLVLPMIDNTIAAARAAGGARVVLPGTVYNYDPEAAPVIDAATPQQPKSAKGRIRVALEQRLEAAAPDVPSLILRAGDFFGPDTRQSWFSQAMVAPGKPLRRIVNPATGPGHSWAYLPDLAEAFARLMAAEARLRPFERVQFEGVVDESGTRMTDAIQRVAGRSLPVWRFPWWLMSALAPFGGMPREVAEIAPHWRHPMRFDNRRLVELIGAEPRTDLDAAIRQTLLGLGCLENGHRAAMPATA